MPDPKLPPLIHVIDDDESLRHALVRLLEAAGFEARGHASAGDFLLQPVPDRPGCLLLDVRMPGTSGLTVLDTLVAQGVEQPVIMLTGHGTVDLCRRAFKSGAFEFLEKPVDEERLLEALQNAVRQHVQTRERHQADRHTRAQYAQLSERECEVLSLIVAGLTNKEMGRALQVSPRTVETHRANLFAKLEISSLAQLVRQYASLVDEHAQP